MTDDPQETPSPPEHRDDHEPANDHRHVGSNPLDGPVKWGAVWKNEPSGHTHTHRDGWPVYEIGRRV